MLGVWGVLLVCGVCCLCEGWVGVMVCVWGVCVGGTVSVWGVLFVWVYYLCVVCGMCGGCTVCVGVLFMCSAWVYYNVSRRSLI